MKSELVDRRKYRNLRIWNRSDKIGYIKTYIDNCNEKMLELGPSIAPIWDANEFSSLKYLETCDSAGLDERARVRGKKNPIEKVDYVFDPDKGFAASINHSCGYRYISSSHVIEHIPDFVGHLKGIQDILSEGSYYFAVVPDKNMIFDKARPCSSLGDMVAYHVEGKSSLSAMIDSKYYSVEDENSDGRGWWNMNDNPALVNRYQEKIIRNIDPKDMSMKELSSWYGHFHVFDPISFSKIINGLNLMGLVDMSLCDVVSTGHMDFIAIFRNDNGASAKSLASIASNLDGQNYPSSKLSI